MFAISKKFATLRLLLFGIIALAIVSVAGISIINSDNSEVDAATSVPTVRISYCEDEDSCLAWYGPRGTLMYTHYFYVDGERAFCANANKKSAEGDFKAGIFDSDELVSGQKKSDLIKLMIYIYFHHDNGSIANDIFSGWITDHQGYDEKYAFTHTIIGFIYDGEYMNDVDEGKVQRAVGILADAISNDESDWLVAQKYPLLRATPIDDMDMQAVMWLGDPRGDLQFKKVDSSNNDAPMGDVVFQISRLEGEDAVESHYVVTNANGIVNTSASFIPHTQDTNKYDLAESISSITYQGYGTWFGGTDYFSSNEMNDNSEMNNYGALPWGDYLIQEYSCNANKFCYGIADQKKTVTIDEEHLSVDLGDWENDCVTFSLGTEALDNSDNDHYIIAEAGAKIKDKISYRVKPGMDYTIVGILKDKTTGNTLTINGVEITNSITLNSETERGEATMYFDFDATNLGGKQIVVFEYLYYGDERVAKHTDVDDANQTVTVVSLGTKASDVIDSDSYIEEGEQTIVDTVEYCAKPNTEYTIKGVLVNQANGNHIQIGGREIEGSATVSSTTGCGEAEISYTFDATGLAGGQIVVFEYLYYGDELVTKHTEVNDTDQTIGVLKLGTYAVNKETGKKVLPYGEDVVIEDTVSYCLKAGVEYTIEGTLMNKTTKEQVIINEEPVKQTLVFTPDETCGEFVMEYELNTTDLAGAELIIFENLYIGGDLVIEHNDFDNEAETVEVEVPTPDTGLFTKSSASDSLGTSSIFVCSGVVVFFTLSGYAFKRILAKRRFN